MPIESSLVMDSGEPLVTGLVASFVSYLRERLCMDGIRPLTEMCERRPRTRGSYLEGLVLV